MAACNRTIHYITRRFLCITLLCLATYIGLSLKYYNSGFVARSQVAYSDLSFGTHGVLSQVESDHTEGATSRISSPLSTSSALTDEISLVHLLSYQRSGSSFTGGLFGSNPDAFFIYEPLDVLYSAMFGISPGWTVPTDIFYNKNGQLRDIPVEEISMMEWTLEMIFTCRMSSYPTAMLIHPFWQGFRNKMPAIRDYLDCIGILRLPTSSCVNRLRAVCPKRFDGKALQLNACRDILWNSGTWHSNTTRIINIAKSHATTFQSYFTCVDQFSGHAQQCARTHLDQKCSGRTIRAVKTVRSPMTVAGRLLEKYSNARVFHLLRDPRGATRSRSRALWSYGLGQDKAVSGHAGRYCPNVVRDFKQLKDLSQIYPGRTMYVIYDGFVLAPMKTAETMYRLVGKPVPMETKEWIALKTVRTKENITSTIHGRSVTKEIIHENSTYRASVWKTFYTYEQMQELRSQCNEFFKTVEYPWT